LAVIVKNIIPVIDIQELLDANSPLFVASAQEVFWINELGLRHQKLNHGR